MNQQRANDYINTLPGKLVSNPNSRNLAGLYAITDASETDSQAIIRGVEQALRGGARLIQYRDKSKQHEQRLSVCHALRKLTQQYEALLIINDDVKLSIASKADGVHLGQDDTGLLYAREQLGHNAIIGISCYNRFDLAQQAQEEGANYVAFGRFFSSHTKPYAITAELNLLHRAKQELNLPIAAIGGVTAKNGKTLLKAGADMLAVVNDIFAQADIEAAAGRYRSLFEKNE